MVDSAIDGYNGTIFAYGQTGSGKTYTMTGGTEKYADRGMIPRTISYLFDCVRKSDNQNFTIFASYLEIYNNVGYDLLSTDSSKNEERRLENLERVVPFEVDGELILKGITTHKVENEEDLLNLLFIGDTNRVVCETPMNDVSTRSHCIFTMYIEARQVNSEIKRKSKVHLVDLSGSERVAKTGLDGTRLQEACSINLSLHYLAHVIVCLQRKMKGENVFVPYRNSLMTMMLKDSLGGNCITRMVATIHPKISNLHESISTCQFAQRVAMIKNSNVKNEIVDPDVIIAQLKRENEELKSELLNFKDPSEKTELTLEDETACEKWVDEFVKDKSENYPMIINGKLMINHSLYYFRKRFWKIEELSNQKSAENNKPISDISEIRNNAEKPLNLVNSKEDIDSLNKEISKLKMLNLQKDNEITILLKLMKKNEDKKEGVSLQPQRQLVFTDSNLKNTETNNLNYDKFPVPTELPPQNSKVSLFSDLQLKSKEHFMNNFTKPDIPQDPFRHLFHKDFHIKKEDISNPKFCFEMFRKNYKLTSSIEEDIINLKLLYDNGKLLTKGVRDSKDKIEKLKEEIEFIRKKTEIINIAKTYNGIVENNLSENELHTKIMTEKRDYVFVCEKLKTLKVEIERMENDIKRRRAVMQKDFEKWFDFNSDKFKNGGRENNENMDLNAFNSGVKGNHSSDLSTKIGFSKDELGGFPNDSKTSSFSPGEVNKDIENFYKARNEAFKKMMSS